MFENNKKKKAEGNLKAVPGGRGGAEILWMERKPFFRFIIWSCCSKMHVSSPSEESTSNRDLFDFPGTEMLSAIPITTPGILEVILSLSICPLWFRTTKVSAETAF